MPQSVSFEITSQGLHDRAQLRFLVGVPVDLLSLGCDNPPHPLQLHLLDDHHQ
jgi:hypothetical protein